MTGTRKDREVSNNEIDWFLRGKLPESQAPMPVPHKHTSSASSSHTMKSAVPASQARSPSPVHSPQALSTGLRPTPSPAQESTGHILTRTKSLPAQPVKKKGFFKSIFSKKSSEPQRLQSPTLKPMSRDDSHLSAKKPAAASGHDSTERLQRTKSLAFDNAHLDPKLEEFFRYYKAKGFDKLQQDLSTEREETSNKAPSVSSSISSASRSDKKKSTIQVQFDVRGRPIPPHPATSPWPSAMVHEKKAVPAGMAPVDSAGQQSSNSGSRLGFLRRHHSSASDSTLSRTTSAAKESPAKPTAVVIPGLENLPKLKRVSFDVPVFFNDPPQQIPSRTPRKGEVEILKDGSIVIHKLSLAERRQILTQGGGGLVVGGSGHLKITTQPPEGEALKQAHESEHTDESPGSPVSPTDSIDSDISENEGHSRARAVAAAEAAAEARGHEAPNELSRTRTNCEDEVTVSTHATKINIDKPMIRHNKSSASLSTDSTSTDMIVDQDGVYPPQDTKVPLDVLYTRCCHLREILPIPATMKQIKPKSTDPIALLQLRNPKPSLVEVLTFSDFISIAPVLCVSLDGVSLSSEMFRIILSALVAKKEFEKLTLRNTPIDEMGWRLLCWFLTKNKSLSRIDLTNVPSLHTNVQKPSKTSTPSTIVRMECDMNSRSDMNWNLFNAALMSRNGVEELIINGAKMSDEEFANLIDLGVSISTKRLGLAYNDLTKNQVMVLGSKLDVSKVIGLDLGYNDLSTTIKDFLGAMTDERIRQANFRFLSFNSCNLNNDGGVVDRFISNSTGLKDLRYLDLSNNKKLFPAIMIGLAQCLPLFPRLSRIHLEYNDMNQNTIVAFAELIPFCKSLSYVSLIGNHIDFTAASALATAIKNSKSVMTLDIDFDEIPAKFKDEISLYTVRNMQQEISSHGQVGSDLAENELNDLQEEITKLITAHDDNNIDSKLVERLLKKTLRVRKNIHDSIDELFKLRLQGQLNTEGKEALIRFCFIDSSIEKGLHLLGKRATIHDMIHKLEVESKDSHRSPLAANPVARRSSTNIALSDYMDTHGHAELLPFGVSQTHADHSETQAITEDDPGRAKDDSKLKEEASVLKLAGMIKSSGLVDQIIADDQLANAISNISGEDLKNSILKSNDVDTVMDALEKLKEKGVTIGDIYKKSHPSDHPSDHQDNFLSNKDRDILTQTMQNTASNMPAKKIVSNVSEADSGSETESDTEEEEELNNAYDQILDTLQRVRTSTGA